jgi:hypothetical protein
MDDAALLCSARECLTSRPFADLRQLPGPERSGAWVPEQPGHYVVRAHLSGDTTLSCQIDVDVVESSDDVVDRGGDDPHRWAACIEAFTYPVNNPGLPPFALDSPEVTLAGGNVGVEFSVTARHDELLRAWFILSPRGLPEPWRVAMYQSPIKEHVAQAGVPVHFDWSVAPGDSLPPGAYELTVWIHHQSGGIWQHAAGGLAMDGAVIVDADGTLRRGGPLVIEMREDVTSIPRGVVFALPVQVRGAQGSDVCVLRWNLRQIDGAGALDGSEGCTAPSLALPPDLPAGSYRFTMSLYAGTGQAAQQSDGLTTTVTVTDAADERSS